MHDRIGEAIPEANCPYGVFLNPKNCEFGNASFLGIRKDDVLLFSIDGREERIREVCEDILSKASLASIEDDFRRKAISLNTLRSTGLSSVGLT